MEQKNVTRLWHGSENQQYVSHSIMFRLPDLDVSELRAMVHEKVVFGMIES